MYAVDETAYVIVDPLDCANTKTVKMAYVQGTLAVVPYHDSFDILFRDEGRYEDGVDMKMHLRYSDQGEYIEPDYHMCLCQAGTLTFG